MSDTPRFLRLHWIDQITGNPKQTADFYSNLLGFQQCAIDEPGGYTSYSMQDKQGQDIFGVVEEAVFKDWAPGWVVYFEVQDFEGYCDKIKQLGGVIIRRGKNQCLFKDPARTPSVLVKTGGSQP